MSHTKKNITTAEKIQKKRALRLGGYSMLMTAAVIAAAIVINMIVEALPAKYTQLDITESSMYEITDETREFLDKLNTNVTVYLVIAKGYEDRSIETFLERYCSYSNKLKLKKIDSDIDPGFVEKYDVKNANSIVVVSDKRSKTIDYNDIFEYSQDLLNKYYSSYYYYGYKISDVFSPDVFDGNNELTSAIDYVTTDYLPTAYMLTGHGESAIIETITNFINENNVKISEGLNLVSSDVPDDASNIIINNPTSDISTGELEKLTAFIDGGGAVVLITDSKNYSTVDMPNLTSLAQHCGLTAYDGIVLESDTSRYAFQQYFIIPTLNEGNTVTAPIQNPSKVTTVMMKAHAIVDYEDYDGPMTVSPILTTSDSSYIIGVDEAVRAATDDDKKGEFYIGAISEDSDTGAKFVWYSSSYLISEQSVNYVSSNNFYVFIYTILQTTEKTSVISLDSIALTSSVLTFSEAAQTIWEIILQVLIPLAIITPGLVVFIKRRRR